MPNVIWDILIAIANGVSFYFCYQNYHRGYKSKWNYFFMGSSLVCMIIMLIFLGFDIKALKGN
jgi:hypothetical protein